MPLITRERRDQLKRVLQPHPRLLRAVRHFYGNGEALKREVAALILLTPRLLRRGRFASYPGALWRRELPVQAPSGFDVSSRADRLDAATIKRWCHKCNLPVLEGGDALYLPPESWSATPLAHLQRRYPPGVGLKIAKLPGGSDGYYMEGRFGRSIQQKFSFSHRKQTLTFNFLHLQRLAPRLYDLLELTDGNGTVWAAYVVEHIEGAALQPGDHEWVVGRLRALQRERLIELISMAGWGGMDFEAPNCNGNLVRSEADDRPLYVDIHNFVLDHYEDHLLATAKAATAASHFGGRSLVLGGMGGNFLYQEIPGVGLPAKRSPRKRMEILDALQREAGVTMAGKVVFDIGCNLGLMGAEYLRRGAYWLHGWDKEEVVAAARTVLLSIGCTRFSLTGGHLTADLDLAQQLPSHLARLDHDDAIVSYLAIRGHLGWLSALTRLPWRYMIYEGHQNDGPLETYVEELKARMPVRLAAAAKVADGVSEIRDLAVLERIAEA